MSASVLFVLRLQLYVFIYNFKAEILVKDIMACHMSSSQLRYLFIYYKHNLYKNQRLEIIKYGIKILWLIFY